MCVYEYIFFLGLSLSGKHLQFIEDRLQEQLIRDADVCFDYTPFLTPFHFHLFGDWGSGQGL